MSDGLSNDPVIASTPAPIHVEPRTAPPAEVAEVARQADEAAVAKDAPAPTPAKEEKAEAKPKLSTRDAIRAAAAKVEAESAKPISVAAKPAEAKVEPAAKADASKEAKVEPAAEPKAKAEPAAEPDAKTTPPRAEDGKFTKAAPDPAAPAAAADAPKAAEPAKPALPSHTASAPPARFSQAAKDRWAEAPEEVRAETERAVSELTKGFEKHRAAAERDAGLAEFHEMATKGGTDVKTALGKYVAMENQLRADPIKGLEMIAQNAGLSLRDVAAQILNQPADQVQAQSDQRVIALEKEIAELKKGFGSIQAEKQQAVTNTTTEAVTKFAADHPRFDELSDDIAFFLKTRTQDLAEAYSLAERLNPAPAVAPQPAAVASSAPVAASAPTPTLTVVSPAAHTRDAGARSIAGTPNAGSDPVTRQPSSSIKEAIRKAAQRAG